MQKVEILNRTSTLEPSALCTIEWVISFDDTQAKTTASFEIKKRENK